MTEILLLALLVIIVTIAFQLSRQSEQQHRDLYDLLNDLATMVGEAIDQNERK